MKPSHSWHRIIATTLRDHRWPFFEYLPGGGSAGTMPFTVLLPTLAANEGTPDALA